MSGVLGVCGCCDPVEYIRTWSLKKKVSMTKSSRLKVEMNVEFVGSFRLTRESTVKSLLLTWLSFQFSLPAVRRLWSLVVHPTRVIPTIKRYIVTMVRLNIVTGLITVVYCRLSPSWPLLTAWSATLDNFSDVYTLEAQLAQDTIFCINNHRIVCRAELWLHPWHCCPVLPCLIMPL